jgi:predicted amidohydrolase
MRPLSEHSHSAFMADDLANSTQGGRMRVAVVQRPPVLLDRSRTIDDAVATIREVAANGAKLVVFPEAYYDSVVFIGPDGSLLNRHRKLMPTIPERMVWGFGDVGHYSRSDIFRLQVNTSALKPVEFQAFK